MDSLRYWVLEMHVDGFRFDLASALARELHEVDRLSAFFDIIHQDPVLSQVKLIAEPWDLGDGGYQVGNFPVLWTEWNGRYRDTVRRFWRGDAGSTSELATRLAGSSDLYEDSGRRPYASINFVTAHDGFTLHDLVSYNDKHNEANRDDNRDGENHNLSWNCGAEGPTDDPDVRRAARAPEAQHPGDAAALAGRTDAVRGRRDGTDTAGQQQRLLPGQRNQLAGLEPDPESADLLAFTARLIQLQHDEPVLHRRSFFQGRAIRGSAVKDIAWLDATGAELSDREWQADLKCFGMLLAGDAIDETDARGRRIVGSTLFVMFHSGEGTVDFVLPAIEGDGRWIRILDTVDPLAGPDAFEGSARYRLEGRSVAVLRRVVAGETTPPTDLWAGRPTS